MNENKRTLYTLKANEGTVTYMQAILGMLIFQMVIGIVQGGLKAAGIELSNAVQLMLMAGIQMIYIAIVLLNVKLKTVTFVKTAVRRPTISMVWLPVLIGVISLFSFIGLNVLFDNFLEYIGYNSQVGFEIKTALDLVLAVIVTVIFAPIGEELVFRGALMFSLRKCGKWVAITLAAAAFALMHMNPQQTFYQFAVGFVCGMVAWESKSIVPAMILHATNNLMAIFITVSLPLNQFIESIYYNDFSIFIIIGAVIIGAAAVYFLCRLLGKLSENSYHDAVSGSTTEDATAPSDAANLEQNLYYHPVDVPNPLGAMGKISSRVYYIVGIVMCAIMWLSVFAMSISSIGA